MLFYIGIISLASMLVLLSDFNRDSLLGKLLYWGAFCVIGSLVAFRWGVGQDFAQFYDVETVPFDELRFWPVSGEEFNRFGILLKGLYYASDYLHYRPLVFIVSGFSTYYLWFRTIEQYSCNRFLSFSVIIAFYLSPSFNAVWQLWAVGFVFYGYKYVKEKKLIPFILCVVAGWSIHASAVLALLIYPIYNWIPPKKTLLISIIAAFTGGLLWKLITVVGMYGHYAERVEDFPGGKKLQFIFPVLLLLSIVLYCFQYVFQKKGDDRSGGIKAQDRSDFWRMAALVSVGCVFPFLLGPHIGNRCGFYFQIFLTLLLPIICKQIRGLPLGVSLVFCSFFFVTIHLYRSNPTIRDTHIPYRSIFSADFNHVPWENETND